MNKVSRLYQHRQDPAQGTLRLRNNIWCDLQPFNNSLAQIPLVSSRTPRRYLFGHAKRSLDIIVSSILLILLFPLLLIIGLLIKLSSRGPIFFTQFRYGAGLKEFRIIKFRSMYVTEAVDTAKQATKDDPRITPIGRFIRKSSLDELPQLVNVLRGEMSLVGPRPHPISLDHYYKDLIPNYLDRYSVRPGISGYAQVNGARGETPTVECMKKRIGYDLAYIKTANLLGDIWILCRTVHEVLASRTAY
ncbi:exopolysaccharide biosynthesis polyprenyl glycosylphosphotransferase [Microvirga sp. BT689]|uniref:exopolysaccharide biosynthesis polyprenyl glycosylphosphotransferase n=1 Tax=Microvirga arvi TaxID=2778731 RepID=UPI00194F6906|nr:exopolysaccharide biosynthesis polyprenyl glycosylphosphotransferase [Microvirga arvi]MBM6584149.1 exopolysaccharide biosynthesis polyprenyl glycosylphosphotransferase [Microvirga arvi]